MHSREFAAALEPLATRPGHLVDGAPKELSSYTPFAPSVGVAGRLHPSVGKREDPARGRRRSIAARCALAYGSTVSVRCAVCVLAARIGRFDRYRHHHDHHLHQHGAAGAALAVRELYERLQPALGALRVLCCAPVTLPTTYDGAVCTGCVVSSDFDVCCDVSYPAWRSGSRGARRRRAAACGAARMRGARAVAPTTARCRRRTTVVAPARVGARGDATQHAHRIEAALLLQCVVFSARGSSRAHHPRQRSDFSRSFI